MKCKIMEYKDFCKEIEYFLNCSLNKENNIYSSLTKKEQIKLYEFIFFQSDSLLTFLTTLYIDEKNKTEESILRKIQLQNLMETFQRAFFLITHSYIKSIKNGKIIKINKNITYNNLNFIKTVFTSVISNIENLYLINK